MARSKYTIASIVLVGISAGLSAVHAEVELDGSTGSSGSIELDASSTYVIDDDVGFVSDNGSNLFHSFSAFNVNEGETALFTSTSNLPVENIISRVTGNDPSRIFGTLSSDIEGANLYLINPNGILFGETATLNITGSFYASTADRVNFDNGDQLHVDIGELPVFSSAEPAAFGFLDNSVASIDIEGAQLQVNSGESVNLIGGDINFDNWATINADAGLIRIASVDGANDVSVSDDQLTLRDADAGGDITLSDESWLDSSGNIAGHIIIRGGNLYLDSSYLTANNYGTATAQTTKNNIDIHTSESVQLDNFSQLYNDNVTYAGSKSGGISIRSDSVQLNNHSAIYAGVFDSPGSDGGDITIVADKLTLSEASSIETFTNSDSSGGDIRLDANIIELNSGATLYSETNGSGNGGDIHITANHLQIMGVDENPVASNFGTFFNPTQIITNGPRNIFATGQSGDILIEADTVDLLDGGRISHNTLGPADSGDISILSNTVNITGTNQLVLDTLLNAGIDAKIAEAEAGSAIKHHNNYSDNTATTGTTDSVVSITTNNLHMSDGAFISTESGAYKNSAKLQIQANSIELKSGAYMTSSNRSSAFEGGDIEITADKIRLDGNGSNSVSTGVYSTMSGIGGKGGDIHITTDSIHIANNAQINSESQGASDGGNIEINASRSIIMTNDAMLTAKASTESNGNAGNINISAKSLALIDSHITTTAVLGNGGDIYVDAKNITINDNSSISSASQVGINGTININGSINTLSDLAVLQDIDSIDVIDFSNDCYTDESHSRFYITNSHLFHAAQLIPSFDKSYLTLKAQNLESREKKITTSNFRTSIDCSNS